MYFAEDLLDEMISTGDVPRSRLFFVGPAIEEAPRQVEKYARLMTQATMVEVEPVRGGWTLRFSLDGRRFRIDYDRPVRETRFIVDSRHAGDPLLLEVLDHFRRLFVQPPPRVEPVFATSRMQKSWVEGGEIASPSARFALMIVALGMGVGAAALTASMVGVGGMPPPPRRARPAPAVAPPVVDPAPPLPLEAAPPPASAPEPPPRRPPAAG